MTQSADKKYFAQVKGINTEAPLVAWPEGFTIDEQNFDLLIDGSRRRRPGLGIETVNADGGGAADSDIVAAGSSTDSSCGMRPYRWTDAGLISGNNLVCMQIGTYVHFWIEPTSGALGQPNYEIYLGDYLAESIDPYTEDNSTASLEDLRNSVVSFSQVNGKLMVVGPYIEALLIDYELLEDILVVTELKILERDLFGIDDGVAVNVEPEEITNAHEYNLVNRGWNPENIDAFQLEFSRFPSKNMLHHMGMRRQVDATTADEDATKAFVPAAIEAELFQNMSAPQGHVIREVFNRRNSFMSVLTTPPVTQNISAVSATGYTVTITTDAAHGVSPGDIINLTGLRIQWKKWGGEKVKRDYIGPVTVLTVPTTTTLTFTVNIGLGWTFVSVVHMGDFINQNTVTGSVYNEHESAAPIASRFTQCAAFASRLFYSGCEDHRISNRVYFTKLVEVDVDLTKCYQEADPTSEFISDLVATDGGYVVLPAAGVINGLHTFGNSLIVFATNGVWEIGPGKDGTFAATGYSVKKLSDVGSVSTRSIITVGNVPMYWAEDGVYSIQQDPNSGYTTAINMTRDVINGLYNSIRYQEKSRAKGVFDSVRQRVMWLYNSRLTATITSDPPATGEDMVQTTPVTPVGTIDDTDTGQVTFDSVLVYDLRLGAWTRWTLGASTTHVVRDILSMPSAYITNHQLRLKVFCQQLTITEEDPQTYRICEFNDDTTFLDNGAEAQAFLYSGPDSMMEPERFKTAPYVHVFLRQVEGSGLKMQARWDWAKGHTSGKITNYTQVYRETRPVPESYGMLVTKNKIPGRGRNLFLAFTSEAGKPAWLDGWTTKYDAQMRI